MSAGLQGGYLCQERGQDERYSWKLWLATSNRRSEEIWFLCSPKEGKHAQRHGERNGLSDVQYLISRFNY